jgi:hypothetical protein
LTVLLLLAGCLVAVAHATFDRAPKGERFECSLDDLQTFAVCSSALSRPGLSAYVTDVIGQSTDHLQDFIRVVAGRPGFEGCALDRVDLVPGTNVDPRLIVTPFSIAPTILQPTTPFRAPPGLDLCVGGDQTLTVTVLGYIAP